MWILWIRGHNQHTVKKLSKPVVFAFDMSIVIANPGPSKCKEDIMNINDNKND